MADNNKNVALATLGRLRGRERLMELARKAGPTRDNTELERLKIYLLDWALCQRTLDSAREQQDSALEKYMKSDSPTIADLIGGSDLWAVGIIESAMTDLVAMPRGSEMHSALRVRYLNEGISKQAGMAVRVFRHGRLQNVSLMEADRLADEGELALIPLVKKRALPL